MKDTRDLNLVEGRFGWEESFSSRMSSGIERLVDFFFPFFFLLFVWVRMYVLCLCRLWCQSSEDTGFVFFFSFEGAFDLLGKLMGLNLFFLFFFKKSDEIKPRVL